MSIIHIDSNSLGFYGIKDGDKLHFIATANPAVITGTIYNIVNVICTGFCL